MAQPRTLFMASDRSGCVWYRQTLFGRALKDHDPGRYALIETHTSVDVADRLLEAAQVLVYAWRFNEAMEALVDEAHAKGVKVVFNVDDDVYHPLPFQDGYRFLGTKEVFLDLGGRTRPLWLKGLAGFDPERNARMISRIERLISAADALVVTTDILAQTYAHLNQNICVIPNALDLAAWPRIRVDHPGEFRLGWQGGASHFEDWLTIAPVLARLFRDERFLSLNPKLVIAGTLYKGAVKDLPPERIESHPWVDVEAHSWRQATLGLDLALIPLADAPFNRAKSALKWIEAAALGVPAVCADIPPYSPVVERGRDGFLAGDPEAWFKSITTLAFDPARRRAVADAARAKVEALYDIRHYHEAWDQITEALMDQPRIIVPGRGAA